MYNNIFTNLMNHAHESPLKLYDIEVNSNLLKKDLNFTKLFYVLQNL